MGGMVELVTGLLGGWLVTFLAGLFVFLFLSGIFGGRPKNFPPGPTILPFLGTLEALPFGPSTEFLRNLRKKYGDMASFGIFGNRIVLVSGLKLMKAVFNLPVTTHRPELVITTSMSRIMTDGRASETGLAGTTDKEWQDNRRFVLHHLHNLGFGKKKMEPVIVEEVTELMEHLAKQEGESVEVLRLFNRYTLNVLWRLALGKRFTYDDPKLAEAMKKLFHLSDFYLLRPLSQLPFMLHLLPYAPIRINEIAVIRDASIFVKGELKEFQADEERRNGDNLMAIYMREIEKNQDSASFSFDQLKGTIFDFFAAGQETISKTLCMSVYLLAKHPRLQRRLQEELDEVVGVDRRPSLADMERLPYLRATICEIQRVSNLFKIALPHMTSEDCQLGGFDIPKGTWLLPNLDDIHTNPLNWKNPEVFDPQNFLDENGKFELRDAFAPFGVGKRVCPGKSFATVELFVFISHLFHKFTFSILEEKSPFSEANPTFNAAPDFTITAECRIPGTSNSLCRSI